jgi:hypothetical protein
MAPFSLDHLLHLAVIPLATRTTSPPWTRILPRQAITTVTVTTSANGGGSNNGGGSSNLDGGSIAGIVIGSVLGVLLIIWLVRWATAGSQRTELPHRDHYYTQETSCPRSRSHRRGSIEIRTSAGMQPVVTSPARVYVGEKRHHSRGRSSSRY